MGLCIAESVNFGLTGDRIRSPDFARCDLDGLDLPHLARRVPAPPAPSKRKHAEKQVQPNKRSRVGRPTTSVAGPSPTVSTRESRGRAAFEQVADRLRSAGHIFITPIILNTLPSERIYRLICSFMVRATIIAFYDMTVAWNSDSSSISRAAHAKAQAKTASERLAVVEKLIGAKNLRTYLTRYHQLQYRLDSDAQKLGRYRHSPEAIKKMQEQEGMIPKALEHHLLQGRRWTRLCKIYCGLLPLTSCLVVTMGAKFSGKVFLDEAKSSELEMMMQNEAAKKLLRETEAFINAVEQGEKVTFSEDVGRDVVLGLVT
ncbi:lysine specific demethylase 4c [Fusarium mexicanum]|uniref:Lysine specific demethylase 4c n=1 Tax=Fusarium mexicanum TaxID=751941 RepID=A0A8H5J8Q0_9HYPO|nr:lysine specific demethylase 4c [Fusarium mexicanum]